MGADVMRVCATLTKIDEDGDEDVYQDCRCDEDESEAMGRALDKWGEK